MSLNMHLGSSSDFIQSLGQSRKSIRITSFTWTLHFARKTFEGNNRRSSNIQDALKL